MTRTPVVYIFGNGLVGGMVRDTLRAEGDVTVVSDTDVVPRIRITSKPSYIDISRIMDKMKDIAGDPDLIINAIGTIGKPNVDWCEDHKEETKYGNIDIPCALAVIASEERVPMIHISTGCIFSDYNGQVFEPGDTPNFTASFYSWSKKQAEDSLQNLRNVYPWMKLEIHRIRMPFMAWSDPRNLINKLIKYDTLVDSPNSMTCLEDYVEFISGRVLELVGTEERARKDGWFSIKHAVNAGPISHKEIVGFLKEFSDVSVNEKTYITPQELNAMTKTPRSNCILGSAELPDVRTSFLRVVKQFKL